MQRARQAQGTTGRQGASVYRHRRSGRRKQKSGGLHDFVGRIQRLAPRRDLLTNVWCAFGNGEIRLLQFAVRQVNKPADRIQRIAVAQHFECGACGQGGAVDLDDMGARRQTIQAVLALFIGHCVGAILQIKPYARNAGFTRVLDAVLAAVGKHLANKIGLA